MLCSSHPSFFWQKEAKASPASDDFQLACALLFYAKIVGGHPLLLARRLQVVRCE